MAQVSSIMYGVPTLLTQNVVYAIPPERLNRLTCDDTTATFQVANDLAMTNPQSATLSGSGYDTGGQFIRVTNKNATVNLRRWF